MRLGFIGVGRWAQKLASAFRECGAKIVAHERSVRKFARCQHCTHDHEPDDTMRLCHGAAPWGFGPRVDWRSQLADKSIDAIVAAATPEVTTEVALACAAAGKPCMVTKPLWNHPETISAPFYVDFWRLWSASHTQAHNLFLNQGGVESHQTLCIALYGSGPFRDFPGMFDYGPHVIAAMLDIAPECKIMNAKRAPSERGEFFTVEAEQDGKRIVASFGNGAKGSSRCIGMPPFNLSFEEGTMIGTEEKDAVLRRFCASFLLNIQEGYVSPLWLDLSRRSMATLRQIREMAN